MKILEVWWSSILTFLRKEEGRNFVVVHTPIPKLTWVDQKHHELLSLWGARVLNFSTVIYPLPERRVPHGSYS